MNRKRSILAGIGLIIILIHLLGCTSIKQSAYTPQSVKQQDNAIILQGDPAAIWEKLQPISSSKLINMRNDAQSADEKAWIELALISKQNNSSNQQFANRLLTWRENNPSHVANQLIPDNAALQKLSTTTSPKHIALLLPLSGTYGSSGQNIREGFLRNYFSNLNPNNQQSIKFYDTQSKPIAQVYQQAVTDGADCIIGPLVKNEVEQLNQDKSINLPTLTLNYSDSHSAASSPYIYEFGLAPEDEIQQMASRALKAGLNNALIIAPENERGKRLTESFLAYWRTKGGNIQDSLYYSAQTDFTDAIAGFLKIDPEADKKLMQESNNKKILEQQRRQDFNVIFIFSQPKEARIIVPLLRFNYVNDVPIYATSSVISNKNSILDSDLNGVTICDIPRQQSSNDVKSSSGRLYAVGQDAYLLSQSLHRLSLLPNFPVYGSTGALSLTANHQIHRRLPCRTIQNGQI